MQFPTKIDHYQRFDLILKTQDSFVFFAEDMKTGRKVVMKFSTKEELKNEFVLMRKFNCPYIMQAIDLHQFNQFNVIILPRALSGDLYTFIQDNAPFEESTVRKFMYSLFRAVDFLHSNGFCHRDIKPENIFCMDDSSEPDLTLGDFGFAKFIGDQKINEFCGTPAYMAPEVLTHKECMYFIQKNQYDIQKIVSSFQKIEYQIDFLIHIY